MSETKEESNSASDVKEEKSPKSEDNKIQDESSKDSDKDSAKDEDVKKESGKESGKEESDEDDDDESEEEGMGLLDRPVEVTGCRARKKVERLEVSFAQHKEKPHEIPVGRGDKLGDCAKIEHQISKTGVNDLKPLHRVLFSRVGSVTEIKRNIRKFSGFSFVKGSQEYDKKKAQIEKFTTSILKRMCEIVNIEVSGTKEVIVNRLLEFLLEPKDSGRALPKKKSSKDKKKSSKKSAEGKKPKVKKSTSPEEVDSANESANDDISDDDDEDDNKNDDESKKKSKTPSKIKKTPAKTKKVEKKEKNKKEEKKGSAKRKRDDTSSDSEEEPSSKKAKMPSDDEIKKLVKNILDTADLQEITMKKVIKQVADAYPDCDLSHKKAFIKATIKSVIS